MLREEVSKLTARPTIDLFTYYKTPDPIKHICNFCGNKRETLAWIQEVVDSLKMFEGFENEHMFPHLIRMVKSKSKVTVIIGEAYEILTIVGNPRFCF